MQIENFQKKMLKQILSLPPNVADIAVYILTGVLPIEPHIHIRALSLLNYICHQSESGVEQIPEYRGFISVIDLHQY
jgi:hypothetical protein